MVRRSIRYILQPHGAVKKQPLDMIMIHESISSQSFGSVDLWGSASPQNLKAAVSSLGASRLLRTIVPLQPPAPPLEDPLKTLDLQIANVQTPHPPAIAEEPGGDSKS